MARRPRFGAKKKKRKKRKVIVPASAYKAIENVDYKDLKLLSGFLTPQGKIMSRKRTRTTAKSQRRLKDHVKCARFLGLLPYMGE